MRSALKSCLLGLVFLGFSLTPFTSFSQSVPADPMLPMIDKAGLEHLSDEDKAKVSVLLNDVFNYFASSSNLAGCPTSGVIESRVDGETEGWSGESIVKLQNGQIWQQIEYKYQYQYEYGADVLIVKNDGRWKMKLGSIEGLVGVECISG